MFEGEGLFKPNSAEEPTEEEGITKEEGESTGEELEGKPEEEPVEESFDIGEEKEEELSEKTLAVVEERAQDRIDKEITKEAIEAACQEEREKGFEGSDEELKELVTERLKENIFDEELARFLKEESAGDEE